MKKLLKRILSSFLVAVMLVTTFVCFDFTNMVIKSHAYVSTTKVYYKEYYYASGTQFFGQFAVGWSESSGSKGRSYLTNAGYEVVTGDLQAGARGDDIWIYIGGYRTTSYALATKAVANSHTGSGTNPRTCAYNPNGQSVSYDLIGTTAYNNISGYGHGVVDGVVDLNKNSGSDSDDIYFYVTRNANAGPAVTSVWSNATWDQNYNCPRMEDGAASDCNKGAGGDDIIIHWSSTCTEVSSASLRSAYASAVAILNAGNVNKYSATTWSNLYSKTVAADACLTALNTDGASTYSQTSIDTLTTNITSAISGLQYSIGYDNMFHFPSWSQEGGAGTVSNRTNTGFTWTASTNDGYTNQCQWIACSPSTAYTLSCNIDNTANTEIFVFYYATTSDTTWTQGLNAWGGVTSISFTTPAGCYYLRFRVDVNLTGASRTFSNFRLRKTANYDTGIASQNTTYGAASTYSLSTPTRTGYTFSGWWTGENGTGTRVTNGATITTKYNHTLYSCWVPNYYAVAYNGNGSTGGSTTGSGHVYNTAKALTANGFTKTGYTFAGWATSSTGSVAYSNSQSVTNLTTNNFGTPKFYDPMFSVSNNMSIYNNSGNGMVTHTKVTKETACPTSSNYMIQITTAGTATPGLGGFVQNTQSAASKVFYHVIVAKIPVGYTIQHAENATGTGRSITWLTSQAGTGNWACYIYKHACGSTGTFSTFGHVYLSGTAATSSSPVTWYVGYAQMYEQTTAGNGVVNLYAKWTPNTYTVTYNGNTNTGGSTANSSHTYDTAKALTANGFTKTGYTFKGWATSAANANAGTVAYTDSQSVSNLTATNGGTVTLYAVWKDETAPTQSNIYKRIMADGSSGYYTYVTSADNGSGLDRVQFPTWTNYGGQDDMQSSWETNTAAKGTLISGNAASATYRFQILRSAHNNEAGLYYTHVYSYDQHQYLDGTGENRSTASSGGSDIYFPTLTFYRNYTTSDTTTLAGPVVAGIGQLADASGNATTTYNTYGKMNGSLTPTRTGYTFLGWNTDKSAAAAVVTNSSTITTTYNSYTDTADTRTLVQNMYAIWSINSYTLTINPNSGSWTHPTTGTTVTTSTGYTQNFETSLSLTNPARTGYRFSGWAHSGSGTLNPATNISVSTFTATNETDTAGGYKSYYLNISATANTWPYICFPAYSYTSGNTYKISGWIRVNELSSDVTAKPTFELRHSAFNNDSGSVGRVIKTYSSADADGTWKYFEMTRTFTGTTVMQGSTSMTIAPCFQIFTCNLNGITNAIIDFDLKGVEVYDVTAGAVAQRYSSFTYGAGAGTLTANWTANTYTVAYNGNGNTGGSTASSSHTYAVAKALTTNGFTKTGYTFAGWATSASGSVVYSNGQSVTSLTSTHDTTINLYAKWTANTYTVAYNGNGSTGGSTASSTHTYDTAKNLTANGFTKTGYTFAGWATSVATAVVYSNGQSVTNLTSTAGATVTLYAKWTANTYTVAYNGNGSTSGSTATLHTHMM